MSENSDSNIPPRDLAVIVPAGITFLTLIGLLVVARFYEQLPLRAPECGFREIVGIPCLGCGGTRCMMALSHGEILAGFLFNPAIFIGVIAIPVWFARSFYRYWHRIPAQPSSPRKRTTIKWLMTVGLPLLLLLNWIYLAVYLPEAG